jgi:CubicO group peptidase (beta-lactamase class C family)
MMAGILLLSLAGPLAGQTSPLTGIDAYIRKTMSDWRVPGAAVAVVKNDSVVLLKGYGVRQTGNAAPVDENTLFNGAIHPSAFVAVVAGLLVDEGKLSWDDKVTKHLNSFVRPDPWVTNEATIRDLLANRNTGAPPQRGGFRDRFVYAPGDATPVADVVEAVTGTSWSEFVRHRILEPMGMNTRGLSDLWNREDLLPCYLCNRPGAQVGIEQARVPNITMGHYITENGVLPLAWPPGPFLYTEVPGGESAVDAAKWIRFHLGQGTYDGRHILSASSMTEIQTPHIVVRGGPYYDIPADVSDLWSYGMEWFIGSYRGRTTILRQTGFGSGFRSFIAMIPSMNLGVAVLSNANIRGAPADYPLAIGLRVLDAYLGVPERDWSAEYLTKVRAALTRRDAAQQRFEASRIPGTRPSVPLRDYAGTYTNGRGDTLTIEERGGRLLARRSSGPTATLEHWNLDVFLFADDGPEQYRDNLGSFTIGSEGRVQDVRMTYWGDFRRAPVPEPPPLR